MNVALIAVLTIAGTFGLFLICSPLYFKFGWFKRLYHDLLWWHTPDDSPKSFDGMSIHAKCKHCGKDIMLDSQGNWFAKGEY